jgi:monoamine oxidase
MSALAASPLVGRSLFADPRQGRSGLDSPDPVVVVGAGLAGLHAALLLRDAGRKVVVLEARSYPGGRVRTVRVPFDEGLYGEAGPVRIPPMHQTVLRLVKEHGLNLVPFESMSGSTLVTVGGVTARVPEGLKDATSALELKPDEAGLGQGALLQRYVGDLPSDMAEVSPAPESYTKWRSYDGVTWHEWLRSRGASAAAIRLMTLGGDSRQLSALYVLRQFALLRTANQFYKIHGGMDQLPLAMAAALDGTVRYDAAVVRIDRSGGSVRLGYIEKARAKTIRASRVIFAIPFSTLRQIEIRPPFSSEKTRAIEQLPYFPATRFLLQSRSSFWQTEGLSGSARTDNPSAEIWDCTYDLAGTRGILGATVGGETGTRLGSMSREQAVKFGIDLVAKTFPAMRKNFEKGIVHRWALDPWSRGAFAVFHPGQMTSLMPDISRPEGPVHFAGEHTSPWMGWMEGALESGERAAREILGAPPTAGRIPPGSEDPGLPTVGPGQDQPGSEDPGLQTVGPCQDQ